MELSNRELAAAQDRQSTIDLVDELYARGRGQLNGDVHDLFDIGTKAYHLSLNAGYKRGMSYGLRILATFHYTTGEFLTAIANIQQGVEYAREEGEHTLQMSLLHDLALSYIKLSDYDAAVSCDLAALALANELDHKKGFLLISSIITGVQALLGDHQSAFDSYMELLEIAEREGISMCIPEILNGIGVVYDKIDKQEFASDYFLQAAESARAHGFILMEALAANNATSSLIRSGRLDKAEEANSITADLAGAHDMADYRCASLMKKAHIQSLRNEFDAALQSLQEAQKNVELYDNPFSTYEFLLTAGIVHRHRKEYCAACDNLVRSVETAEATGSNSYVLATLQELYIAYEEAGDFAAALETHKRIADVERQAYQETAANRVKALQIRQQIQNAERESHDLRLKVRQLAETEAALVRQAMQDPLTGLRNRRAMEEWIAVHYRSAVEMGTSLTVALADVDYFKFVNDRFTHQMGDFVLQRVAQIISAVTPGKEVVARYGGEEFFLGFSFTEPDDAYHICEQVRLAVEQYPWKTVEPNLQVTISIGATSNLSLESFEAMLTCADQQLYRAKSTGRNRVCFSR